MSSVLSATAFSKADKSVSPSLEDLNSQTLRVNGQTEIQNIYDINDHRLMDAIKRHVSRVYKMPLEAVQAYIVSKLEVLYEPAAFGLNPGSLARCTVSPLAAILTFTFWTNPDDTDSPKMSCKPRSTF